MVISIRDNYLHFLSLMQLFYRSGNNLGVNHLRFANRKKISDSGVTIFYMDCCDSGTILIVIYINGFNDMLASIVRQNKETQ